MISPFWKASELQTHQLTAFLERSLKPICVYNDRGERVYISQSFLNLLQTQANQANFFDCFRSEFRSKLAKFWQRASQGEAVQFTIEMKDVKETLECSLEFDQNSKLMFLTIEKSDTRNLTEAYEKAILQSAHLNLATALINLSGDVIQCNENLLNLLGADTQEAINLEEFVHPEDRSSDEQSKRNLLDGLIGFYTIEKRLITKNNGMIWVNLSVSSIEVLTKPSESQFFAVILEDITENKKIYSTLVRTEEKWKTLFLNSPYLFIQTSYSGQIIYISPAVESLLGYQSEELLGRQIKELIHPTNLNEIDLALQLWSNNIQTNPSGVEWWWRAKSNRWVALAIQGQRFPSTLEMDGVMMSGHNITDRKALEIELRENEEKFRSLIVNSMGVAFRCDSSYMMQFVSDKIQAITGYPASVFVNNQIRSYLSIVHPDDIIILKDSLMRTILDRHPHSIEYRIIDANGAIRWVTERKQGIFNQNGYLLCLDGLLLEMSDREPIKAELSD
ncbi:PAS domain-containing protein [Leptolyngbya sp. NIES-2104]|uniref:PAS domain-containing protein n=1 Tax=Leptolyngbya sp. NIES-2104 TaxID=1552121 RepID=UPI0006ECB9CA|nr:PAS domain S-box protein [Leptolyngbya sp. NIES-2104]GAP95540.1 sensory box histidine kinase [Leptolyngbya sp. NIES-2104]